MTRLTALISCFGPITAAILIAVSMISADAASASTLRWPRATDAPATGRAAKPAVIMLAPGQPEPRHVRMSRPAPACPPGRTCVVCVANCDDAPPATVYARSPVPAETPQQRTAAAEPPLSGRPGWANIACGSEGGCSVAGIAPARRPREDTVITIIGNFYYSR